MLQITMYVRLLEHCRRVGTYVRYYIDTLELSLARTVPFLFFFFFFFFFFFVPFAQSDVGSI